ncbi:MAG: hypothetical protein PHF00_03365 [Elusimicrobia bacterium]|nr:hypothetical protein [Elusimicrobiota bacterium]
MKAAVLAAWLCAAAGGAPVQIAKSSVTAPVGESLRTLSEMRRRGLVAMDVQQWSPSDMELLLRMRRAEERGALDLLRKNYLRLGALVVAEPAAGASAALARLRLTRRGFAAYLRLRSQAALEYFQSREIGAKWAFQLRDLQGRRLFDRGSGDLTEAGEELYGRAALGLPVFWRLRSGETGGNRPVPPELRSP